MIKINLQPSKKQTKAKPGKSQAVDAVPSGPPTSPLSNLLVVVIVIVCLGAGGLWGYKTYAKRQEMLDTLAAKRREKEKLTDKMKEWQKKVAGLAELSAILKNEIAALDALSPEDRVIWAEKLHMLATMVPENVFFTNIEVTEEVSESLTEESKAALRQWEQEGRQGMRPPARKQVTVTQILEIQGIAFAKDISQAPFLMLDFYDKMKSFKAPRITTEDGEKVEGEPASFMQGFQGSIEILPYVRKKIYDVEVTEFTLKIPAESRQG